MLENDIDDYVNEDMLKNDIDDDHDIIIPFNTLSQLDDDTNVKLDEEEDTKEAWYRCWVGWGT